MRWFAPVPATRLAVLRVAVGAFVLWRLADRGEAYVAAAAVERSHWEPVGPAAWLPGPVDPDLHLAWLYATMALAAAFVLGVGHRVLAPIFAVSATVFFAYRNSWGMVYHTDNLVILHVIVLALAPAAAALSVDARRARTAAPRADARFGWPVRLMCAVTVITYLLAGAAKVGGDAGWAWALGGNLRDQIGKDALFKALLDRDGAPSAVYVAYAHAHWLGVPAVMTLLLELGAPLALLGGRIGRAWALGALAMHWGVLAIMDITFPYALAGLAFLSFFRVERPVAWVRARFHRWRARRPGGPGPR